MTFRAHYLIMSLLCIGFHASAIDPKEIDSLYNVAGKIGASDQKGAFAIANFIYSESRETGYEFGIAKGQILAAYYYINQFKLDTANQLLEACKSYFSSNGSRLLSKEHGAVWYYQGTLFMRKSQFEKARECAITAREISRTIDDPMWMARAITLMGEIEILRQNYIEALKYMSQSYKIILSTPAGGLGALREAKHIAQLYAHLGQYDQALKFSKQILNLEGFPKHRKPTIHYDIAQFYGLKGDPDSALYHYTIARQMLDAGIVDIGLPVSVDFGIADILSLQGNHKKSNQMLKGLMGTTASHLGLDMEVFRIFSKNYLELNRPDSSIYFARKALKMAEAGDNKPSIVSFTYLLSNAFEQKKQYDSALVYLKQYHAYADTVYSLENQQKFSTLYAELQTLEKQGEIDKLEREKVLQEARAANFRNQFWAAFIVSLLLVFSLILAFLNRAKAHQLQKFELQAEIEKKIQDLNQQAIRMIQKNNSLLDVEEGLKKMKKGLVNGKAQEVQHLLNTIRVSNIVDKEWNKFDEYFGQVNQRFFDQLSLKFPELTVNEKRLAALIKMNFTNREIAELMNIEDKSVRMAKYRLKKKLNLEEEDKISDFLHELEQSA